MRKFDLSLRSSRSSYFATFRHQLTILSKTDALDEEKWLNMLGTFVKDWFRYESHFVHGRDSLRSEERFSRNAETDLVCRLLLANKQDLVEIAGLIADHEQHARDVGWRWEAEAGLHLRR